MAAGDGYFVLFCLFLVIGTCLAQKDELGVEESLSKQEELKFKDRGEQFDKDFAVLNQDNSKSVGANESYRCGIFYAGEKGAKPIRALHVLPKRFTFDCSRDYEIMSQEVKKECGSIFELMGKGVTYASPSRFRGDPYSIGDDICRHLKLKAGIKVYPPNRRFPKGVPIGMYYNLCGRREWLDTDIRIPSNVCCEKRNPDFIFEECPK